jgi:hypothetical protein
VNSPWRKSTFSGTGANCVEVAVRGPAVAVRNSNHPDAGQLVASRPAFAALLDAVGRGELDDLAEH